jgi:hypothetical protein
LDPNRRVPSRRSERPDSARNFAAGCGFGEGWFATHNRRSHPRRGMIRATRKQTFAPAAAHTGWSLVKWSDGAFASFGQSAAVGSLA